MKSHCHPVRTATCLVFFLVLVVNVVAQSPQPVLSFASDRTGSFQAWEIRPGDSATLRRRTFSGAQENRGPDWSRLGNIAFQSGGTGVRGIHVIDAANNDV